MDTDQGQGLAVVVVAGILLGSKDCSSRCWDRSSDTFVGQDTADVAC